MSKEYDGEVAYGIEGGKDNTERGREIINRMGEDRDRIERRGERNGVKIVGVEMDGVVRAPEGNSVSEDNVKNRAIEEGKIGEKEVDRNRGRIDGEIEAIPEGILATTLELVLVMEDRAPQVIMYGSHSMTRAV